MVIDYEVLVKYMFFISLWSIAFGAFLAFNAPKFPGRLELMEGIGGCLIIYGLGVIGFCLPIFR